MQIPWGEGLINPKNQKSWSNNQATLRKNKQLSPLALSVYEKDKCIFCQLGKNEKLHSLGNDIKLEETREN